MKTCPVWGSQEMFNTIYTQTLNKRCLHGPMGRSRGELYLACFFIIYGLFPSSNKNVNSTP